MERLPTLEQLEKASELCRDAIYEPQIDYQAIARSGVDNGQRQKMNESEFWAQLRATAAYRKMARGGHVQECIEAFERDKAYRQSKTRGRLECDYARFVEAIIRALSVYQNQKTLGVRLTPTKSTLRQAVARIDKLLLLNSVAMHEFQEWYRAVSGLASLKVRIQDTLPLEGRRQARMDVFEAERRCIDMLADDLIGEFPKAMRRTLIAVASMIAYTIDSSVIDSRIKVARARKARGRHFSMRVAMEREKLRNPSR